MKDKLIVACVMLALAAVSLAAVGDPDLPGYIPKMENLTECTLIIPMDLHHQGDSCNCSNSQIQTFNGTLTHDYNMMSYGLVNFLLWNDIPLKWIIKTGKGHDDIDFSAWTWRLFPNNDTHLAPKMRDFRSGPFVVPIYWTEKAIPLIKNFTNTPFPRGGLVQVFKLAEKVEVDVRYFITSRPFVAVLDSSSENDILTATLNVSGFVHNQHYKIMSKAEAVALSDQECISMAMEPHFYAGEDDQCTGDGYPNSFVAAMRNFTEGGGNFLAMCGGVSTYENCDNDRNKGDVCKMSNAYGDNQGTKEEREAGCPSGFFASDYGLRVSRQNRSPYLRTLGSCASENSIANNRGIVPVKNLAADTPFGQYDGGFYFIPDSANEAMSLWTRGRSDTLGYDGTADTVYNTSLRAENAAHWVIQDASCTRRLDVDRGVYLALHAKLGKFHNNRGGNIFYLSGHDYSIKGVSVSSTPPCNTTECLAKAGQRLIMNAVLTPANRNCFVPFEISPGVFINRSLEITLPDGQNFYKKRDLEWISQESNTTNSSNSTNTIEGLPCNCTARLDRCAVCGGDGQSCVIIIPGGVPPPPLPTDLPPHLVALLTPEVINSTGVSGGGYNGGAQPSNPPIVWPSVPSNEVPPSGGQGGVPTDQSGAPSDQSNPSTGVPNPNPPVNTVNDTIGNSMTVTLQPSEWQHFQVIAGANVADLDIFVSLLSPSPTATAVIYIAKGDGPGGPSGTDQCTYTLTSSTISEHEGLTGTVHFKYSVDKDSAACTLSNGISSSWIISVGATGTSAAALQVEAALTPSPNAFIDPTDSSFAFQSLVSIVLLCATLLATFA